MRKFFRRFYAIAPRYGFQTFVIGLPRLYVSFDYGFEVNIAMDCLVWYVEVGFSAIPRR